MTSSGTIFMEGRSPEILSQKTEATDQGFSEKRAARITEGKQADNSQLSKRKHLPEPKQKPVRTGRTDNGQVKPLKRAARVEPSLKEKLLAAYSDNAKAMGEMATSLTVLSTTSVEAAAELMTAMRTKQKLQEQLLNALEAESKDELTEDTLPKELQDLIK